MKMMYTTFALVFLLTISMAAQAETVNLYITGGTKAQLEAVNGLGGLEARAAYFNEVRNEATPSIVIDIGRFMPKSTKEPIDAAVSNMYQQGMQKLQYDIRSLSKDDLMKANALLPANQESSQGYVATNVTVEEQSDSKNSVTLSTDQTVTVNDLKVGVVAIPSLQDQLKIADTYLTVNTNKNLDLFVQRLRKNKNVDFVVMIISESVPNILPWLNQYEGEKPDLFVIQNIDIGQHELDGMWMTNASGTGNAVSKVTVQVNKGAGIEKVAYERIILHADEYQNSEMRDFLDELYQQKAEELNLTASEPNPLMEFEAEQSYTSGYTGAEKCKECHEDQYNQWLETEHATSFEELLKTNRHWVPQLVQYNVTGYQHDVGYKGFSESPQLRNVQCETCHGPGQAHVDEFGTGEIRRGAEKEMCMQCHTSERTPEFEDKFDLFLKKVEH